MSSKNNNEMQNYSFGVGAKQKTQKFTIQNEINKTLFKNVPISAFIQDVINTKVKNTVEVYCKKCGSDNVFSESRQTRSGDEATTIFFTCLNCGNKWKMN